MEKFGICISVLWFLIIGMLVFLKWEFALKLSLNEWGDFLAGVIAPLAFLWLIVSYNLQRKELKANTEALLFQKEEMANQAKELAEQTVQLAKSARAASDHTDAIKRKYRKDAFFSRRIRLANNPKDTDTIKDN